MNFRNIQDMNQVILKEIHKIPRNFDLIVGVPRSGMLPANLLALYLNLPYTDLHSFINGHIYKAGERGQYFDIQQFKNVLVVDDSVSSGSALKKCKASLVDLESKFNLKYAAIYVDPSKLNSVDYYFESVGIPRYFQWNIFNHSTLDKACFDIDGVLCVDPTPEQNDDGQKYREFILNAAPLYIPKSKIGTLVTSRLEKYRAETEIWLDKQGIKYDNLVMLDLPDQKARQKANCHGTHKANTYKESKYNLFIESELTQAIDINRITKKPVFCTQNFEMIFNSQSFAYNLKSGRYFPLLRKVALKLRDKLRNLKQKIKNNTKKELVEIN